VALQTNAFVNKNTLGRPISKRRGFRHNLSGSGILGEGLGFIGQWQKGYWLCSGSGPV